MANGGKLGLFFFGLGNTLKKNAPTIGMVGGILGILGGTGLACWATLKTKKVVDETNAKIEANKKELETTQDSDTQLALVKENKKEIAKAVGKIAAYFTPSVLLIGGGITSIVAAHAEQGRRLSQATAACSALSVALGKARNALKEVAGDEEEENQRIGVVDKKVKHVAQHVDPETGEITSEDEELVVTDPNLMGSPYALYFDETTSDDFVSKKELTRDDEISIAMKILSAKQDYLNNKLVAYGGEGLYRRPLMFHEILKDLDIKYNGVPRYSEYGEIEKIDNAIASVTGKIYDPANPDIEDHLDLRARVVLKKVLREDGNWDYVKSIVIDPNLDGCVLDYKYRR